MEETEGLRQEMSALSLAPMRPPRPATEEALLRERAALTESLTSAAKSDDPTQCYSFALYLARALVHETLAFDDLAAGDAYRALLLLDEFEDDTAEHHDEVAAAAEAYVKTICKSIGDRFAATLMSDLTRGTTGSTSHSNPHPHLEEGLEGLLLDVESLRTEEIDSDLVNVGVLSEYGRVLALTLLSRCLHRLDCAEAALGFAFRAQSLIDRSTKSANTSRSPLHPNVAAVFFRYDASLKDHNRQLLPEMTGSGEGRRNGHPNWGSARREVYTWNSHEPDRMSDDSLAALNAGIAAVAPKCEVRRVRLPALADEITGEITEDGKGKEELGWSDQLGLFCKEDIGEGETVLKEYSLLTACNDSSLLLCDACSLSLSEDGDEGESEGESRENCRSAIVACDDCDVVFCGEACKEKAMASYHRAVCDQDIDSVVKFSESEVRAIRLQAGPGKGTGHRQCSAKDEAENRLHSLLLVRALALSVQQNIHPLSLSQTRTLWGDFSTQKSEFIGTPKMLPKMERTLPFNFDTNVKLPLHILEKMGVSCFENVDKYDVWVFNTLFAKFRGVASAQMNPHTRLPCVAAIHPLWCLANHSCDPNVTWVWKGPMRLTAVTQAFRDKVKSSSKKDTHPVTEAETPKGSELKAGMEILSHYCDVTLPVSERRAWASGSLGGLCRCPRCLAESNEERAAL